MDVARLNFSHGTHAEHAEVIRAIREGEARWGRPIAILQDLQGPKIRLGTFGEGGGRRVDLEPGEPSRSAARPCVGTAERAYVAPSRIRSTALKPGDQVLDGRRHDPAHASRRSTPDEVRCRVIAGGRISDHKGLSLPRLPLPDLVPDRQGPGGPALRHPARRRLRGHLLRALRRRHPGGRASSSREQGADIPIVAKLERAEVVANLPGILTLVDAVMVARGDLGVDVPLEDVPASQKEIIRQARAAKVPVIVATQMLESMVTHLRPTRAEVSDVATAIFEGADAIMLSAETATGRYPVEAVEVMARIAESRRASVLAQAPSAGGGRMPRSAYGFPEALADAAARRPSARRPGHRRLHAVGVLRAPDLPPAPRRADHRAHAVVEVQRRLAPVLGRGLTPHPQGGHHGRDVRSDRGDDAAATAPCAINDLIVIISGSPMWVAGTTNLMKLHRIGERR